MKDKKLYTLLITPQLSSFIFINFFAYGKSGGDMVIVFFSVATFFFFLFLWGVLSYKWDWILKIKILITLTVVFLLELMYLKLFIY